MRTKSLTRDNFRPKNPQFFRKVAKSFLVYTSKNLRYSSKFLDEIQNKNRAEKC